MSTFALTLVIAWIILLLSFIFLLFAKAYYHFDYLKAIYPEELNKYESYFTARLMEFNNRYIFRSNVPIFKREQDKEKSIETFKKAERVKLLCKLIYFNFIAMITIIVIIVIFL